MKASEILDGAANIILRDGWIQGAYFEEPPSEQGVITDEAVNLEIKANREAPCCQRGAIDRAATGYAWPLSYFLSGSPCGINLEARKRAVGHMDAWVKRTHNVEHNAVGWNDEPTTTKEMVVEALRAAAEDARQAGD